MEPLYSGHHWDPAGCSVWRMPLIQRSICTQLYVVGTADSVLIREVSVIQSVLYREVPLHTYNEQFIVYILDSLLTSLQVGSSSKRTVICVMLKLANRASCAVRSWSMVGMRLKKLGLEYFSNREGRRGR